MEKNKEKIRYRVFTLRLHNDTIEKLKEKKTKSGLSWNLFIYNLIKEDK